MLSPPPQVHTSVSFRHVTPNKDPYPVSIAVMIRVDAILNVNCFNLSAVSVRKLRTYE